MTKLTEAHIRHAMCLKPDVAVMLGKLDGPGMPGIVTVGTALYTYRQHGSFGRHVVMRLQFAKQPDGMLMYPSTVSFSLMSKEDDEKIKRVQVAVSEFVTTLQVEGDVDGAAAMAALLTLTPEDMIRVHDALAVGMTRDAFIKSLTPAAVEAGPNDEARYITEFHVYQVRMTDDGPARLYACGPVRPGSAAAQWRVGKARATCYTAEAVEKLIRAHPAMTLHTEAVD